MQIVIVFIIGVILSAIIFWIVGKFSADSPNFAECLISAFISELVITLSPIPYVGYIVTVILLWKFAKFSTLYAIIAAVLYFVLRSIAVISIALFIYNLISK